MTRAEQINKAVEEIFNNADIALEDRAMLRMWYGMGVKFADDNPKNETNWQQVRLQAAIAAMQGLLACSETRGTYESFARDSVGYADALVKELKGE
jgi:site-specific recombinase XerC